MKKTKMQKGITLIALIITIIILLILAVVTIGSIKNSNIIKYAQNASSDYNRETTKEKSTIAWYESLIEGIPIPEGFKFVEGTKDTGLVIENEIEGSQFVWVPVDDINIMVMCSNKTEGDQCNIRLNAAKTELLCVTHSDSTEICGKLYSSVGDDNINNSRTNQTHTDNNKEPYNLSGETNTTYQSEFNEMAVSVAKNGGFYVGRYEVSFNEEKKAQSKRATDAVPVYSAINSTINNNGNSAKDWYGLYELCKTYNTNSIKSSMIWGSQYDAMMIWMGKEARDFDTSKRNTDVQRRTGYVSSDKIKNVYDLAGNSYEWTLEAAGNSYRVSRGRYA